MVALIATLSLAAAQPPIPSPRQAEERGPPVTQQQAKPSNQAASSNANASEKPGTSSTAPLYVKTSCEHGCGYSEDNRGWWQKLWTDPIATFTAVLALLTAGLIGVGIFQGVKISDQITLARDELNATHRPHITVHFVQKEPNEAKVQFRIVNDGTGDAWVTGSCVMLDYMAAGGWPYPDDLVGPNIIGGTVANPRRFKVGATDRFEFANPAIGQPGIHERLHFVGWVVYHDVLKNPQTTYFCRVHTGGGQFVPATGTDYENPQH